MDFGTGKVAVVTGAASGIGFALADRFASNGMDVVLADVDENGLTSACERIRAHGVDAAAVLTDVSDEESLGELADTAYDRFGAVHVLCNNAGVASLADPWFGPISAWHWVLGVNLWGVVHGVRAFLPRMLAQAEGHIVNTASMAGLQPGASPIYDASKHAVVALSEDLYRMWTARPRACGWANSPKRCARIGTARPRACGWANSPKRCARIVSADELNGPRLRVPFDHESDTSRCRS
jgi:NAD(P)-dependent dehydrogenase (short-subunit alcohol dehydrogenase family)